MGLGSLRSGVTWPLVSRAAPFLQEERSAIPVDTKATADSCHHGVAFTILRINYCCTTWLPLGNMASQGRDPVGLICSPHTSRGPGPEWGTQGGANSLCRGLGQTLRWMASSPWGRVRAAQRSEPEHWPGTSDAPFHLTSAPCLSNVAATSLPLFA